MFRRPVGFDYKELELRCGQCINCRLERSRQWAVRCMHECQMHRASSFVTLTYDEDHLESPSLVYRDFQLFCKKARRKLGPFRFFACGEYGERDWRPHWHAALFGVHFRDRYPWRKSPSGHQLYRSPTLEELWTNGSSEIGAVTFESAAYIARYVVKKVTGDQAPEHYVRMTSYGEVIELEPEMARMSRRPGIGSTWFDKYWKEVFPRDEVVVRGSKQRPPRFYKKLLDELDPAMAEDVEYWREQMRLKLVAAEGPSLRSVELVSQARLAQRSRSL